MVDKVTCLLIDDHALFREALGMMLALRHPQVQLHSCGTLREGLAHLADTVNLPLVLLDLSLPDSRGVATLQRLLAAAPAARVIVLSADDRPETVRAAVAAGAVGFICKTADIEALDAGLRAVLAGGTSLPDLPLWIEPPQLDPAQGLLDRGLTPRQIDVFRLVIEGKPNKLIARELGVSDSTIKTHVQAIFERLDIGSRAQAVVVAARLGWQLPAPLR
jgi:two-component system, NarL family, nitrate/nitrite response regulator NarL